MGTRGLIGVILRDGRRRARYKQFDSQPRGLGVEIINFLFSLTAQQYEEMARRLENITWVTEEDKPTPEEQERYIAAGFAATQVSSRQTDEWYVLLYKTQGAAALPHIFDGTLEHMIDNTSFEDDHLFCEWVYWLDFNRHTISMSASGVVVEEGAHFDDISLEWMETMKHPHQVNGDY